MRKALVPWLIILLSGCAGEVDVDLPPSVAGEPAPEIVIEELLQCPEGAMATLSELRGKVVILEFWATWCSPCVDALPHLNRLAERFTDQPVQFISITYEPISTVLPFLEKHRMAGWVGIDTDQSVFRSYRVPGVPFTAVIDQMGNLVAITSPKRLNEEAVVEILEGRKPELRNYLKKWKDGQEWGRLPEAARW